MDFCRKYLDIELDLYERLSDINFGDDVAFIYRPLTYALKTHEQFLLKYCQGPKKLLYLGLNPGPWGMMQNGIPFGENNAVQQFLAITDDVDRTVVASLPTHPSKPVLGLTCRKSEVSGRRFWTFARRLSNDDPLRFFRHSFVHNYFPFVLTAESGKNLTPCDLKRISLADKNDLKNICDENLMRVVQFLNVKTVIAIGRYVEEKLNKLTKGGLNVKVVYLPHPSPRNAASNSNWVNSAIQVIVNNDLSKLY